MGNIIFFVVLYGGYLAVLQNAPHLIPRQLQANPTVISFFGEAGAPYMVGALLVLGLMVILNILKSLFKSQVVFLLVFAAIFAFPLFLFCKLVMQEDTKEHGTFSEEVFEYRYGSK